MKPVTATIMEVTPHQARAWLLKNNMNRPVNKDNLALLAKEMKSKNFHLTGESIKIAEDGTLLDGQHRLMAIVESGIAVKMFVMKGLPKEAFKFIDTGRMRQAGDVLGIDGIKNPSKIAAVVKFIIAFKRGQYFSAANQRTRGATKITNVMVSDFASKNIKSLYDSYGFGFGKGKRLIAGTLISSMHFLFKNIDEKAADDFINKLVEGTNLTKESPIFMLHEKFIMDARNKKKMKMSDKVALICKSWNLYRTNKKVVRLEFNSQKENFPKPI